MIEFKKVTKDLNGRKVLNELSFSVGTGEIVFVIGKSGMGKSVLLKHIVGLLRPDSGEIWVEGQEVSQLEEKDYFDVRRKCGMVFQAPALLDSLTVFDNVAFGVRAHRLCEEGEPLHAEVARSLKLVNLKEEVLSLYPSQLSYGMQKRVSLARTLAIGPKYLLYDEPTTALDPVATAIVDDLIQSASRKLGVTSIVVSHDMQSALNIADRILMLDQGKILVDAKGKALLNSKEPLVREFLKDVRGKKHA